MNLPSEAKGISHCTVFDSEKSWYDLLTEDEKLLIDRHSVSITFKKGETVCKRGAFASHIYYMEDGLVKVYLEEKSKNLILMLAIRNNLLGMAAIFDGNDKLPYSVTAYTDSKIRMIDINIFRQLLKQNPEWPECLTLMKAFYLKWMYP